MVYNNAFLERLPIADFNIWSRKEVLNWLDECFHSMKEKRLVDGTLRYKLFVNNKVLDRYNITREEIHSECVKHWVKYVETAVLPEDRFLCFVDMEEFRKKDEEILNKALRGVFDD